MRTLRRVAALKALWIAITRGRRADGPSLREQAAALPRLVAMSLSGRYPGLSRSRLGLMALGLLYVISPVDLVPEAAFMLLGLADDAVVLAWLAGAVLSETDTFLDWESQVRETGSSRGHEDVVPGEVIG